MNNLYILKELVRFGFFIEFFNETEALVEFKIEKPILLKLNKISRNSGGSPNTVLMIMDCINEAL